MLTETLVRRHLHVYPPRKENHCLPRDRRKRVHPQWKTQGCQRGRSVWQVDHASLRIGRGLRLSELETDGAEEGMIILIFSIAFLTS